MGFEALNWNGIAASQSINIYDCLKHFCSYLKQNKIEDINVVEIGTANGGFTCILAEKLREHNIKYNFLTFDIEDRGCDQHCGSEKEAKILKAKHFKEFDIKFCLGDCFHQNSLSFLYQFIQQSKPCLVFCDGGNKKVEFTVFSQLLKPMDFIFAHDYAFDKNFFDSELKDIWMGFELTYEDISEACTKNQLLPFMQPLFQKSMWASFRKSN